MRHINIEDEEEKHKFVKEVAKAFNENKDLASYGDLEPGSYLALRWGLGNDCILVLKLDEYFQQENYSGLLNKGA